MCIMVHVFKQSLLEDIHSVSSSWVNNEQRCLREKLIALALVSPLHNWPTPA